jgi:hypothetical protein
MLLFYQTPCFKIPLQTTFTLVFMFFNKMGISNLYPIAVLILNKVTEVFLR